MDVTLGKEVARKLLQPLNALLPMDVIASKPISSLSDDASLSASSPSGLLPQLFMCMSCSFFGVLARVRIAARKSEVIVPLSM
jgi:hypothetical protein